MRVRNVRVYLTGLSRKGPDGLFHSVVFNVPFSYNWAHEKLPAVDVNRQRILDFGIIVKNSPQPGFIPTLNELKMPANFEGFVLKDQILRYCLEIDAENFSSAKQWFYEVAWDGDWDDERAKMEQHLRIREVGSLSS